MVLAGNGGRGDIMAETRTMESVISALFELIESAENTEDIETLNRVEKMFDRRFRKESTLFMAKQEFCAELYAHRLRLMV